MRQLIPIPCPNGKAANGNYLLSVYFAPRIFTGGTIGLLPDWSDWAAASNALMIEVFLDGIQVPPAQITRTPIARSDIWDAVFDPNTPITAFQPVDRRNTPFRTFSEVEVASDILALYTDTAIQNPEFPPSASDLMARPLTSQLLAGGGAVAPGVLAADTFQRRIGAKPVSPPSPPEWDFHQALSLLGRHPHLLRLLGVVVDLEFIGPVLPPGVVAVTTNYVATYLPFGGSPYEIPTRVPLTNSFYAAPRHADYSGGFLTLGDGNWDLVSLDVQNAVRRLVAFARELDGAEDEGALPALDDSGLTLARTGRGVRLNQRFGDDFQVEQQVLDAAASNDDFVQLFVEDVTLGYRVDVRRDGGDPLSLFARSAASPPGYHFPRNALLDLTPPADEGWIGNSLTGERLGGGMGGALSAEKRLSDALARWRGWSLAAPPIGQVADPATNTLETPQNAASAGDLVQFEVNYRPTPLTLPRLVYGSTYRMRARGVNIAGESLAVTAPAAGNALSPAHVYGRLTPIPAPMVVRRSARPIPGLADTTERIVIKSNYNVPYSQIAANDRLIFPAASSQQTCERHALPNGGISGDLVDYTLLADRDGRDVADQTVLDPHSGEIVAGILAGPGVQPGAPVQTAQYLPDPAGRAVTLAGLPGTRLPLVVPFIGAWPDFQSRRLVVQGAASGAPKVAPNGGAITVKLKKAAQFVVEVSAAPGPNFVGHFKLWQAIVAANPGSLNALKQYAQGGRHWMLSARRRIKLVHAVRQPLAIPSVDSLVAARTAIGSKQFALTGVLDVNRPSTGRVILTGTWTDPVDDPALPEPGERTGAAVLGTQRVSVNGDEDTAAADLTVSFVDNKRHQVDVAQEAFTRFARDFAQAGFIVFTTDTVTLDARGVLAALTSLRATPESDPYVEGVDYTLDAAAGTATRLVGGAIPTAQSIVALYVALPLSRNFDEAGAPPHSLLVPNARVPAPLPVHSLVPAFTRTVTTTTNSIKVVANGRMVRCYLERPWFHTGEGELLGVVMDAVLPVGALPNHTRHGRDALLATGGPPQPLPSHFVRATTSGVFDGLSVSGHEVAFDAERQQWYCDIEIDTDLGYRSFTRFVLARFQPEAIDGAHLSQLAPQDPLLLGVHRTVTVRKASKDLVVTVKGTDHTGRVIDAVTEYNDVEVLIQSADPAVTDDELRWNADVLEAPLVLTRTRGANAKQATWTGKLKLNTLPATQTLRAVITESEPFARDELDGGFGVERVPVFTEVADIPADWPTG